MAGIYELRGAGKTCAAKIPGDFHSALIHAKIIDDPYVWRNESAARWVGETDWKITRRFQFKKARGARSFLRIEYADTFFSVALNGEKIGEGGNMFREWRFDATNALRDGENKIEIFLDSPVKRCAALSAKMPYAIPETVYPVYAKGRNMARKTQCSFGWDWGPCLPTSGIYGDIKIETVAQGFIESVAIDFCKKGSVWKIKAKASYRALSSGPREFVFQVKDKNKTLAQVCVAAKVSRGDNEIRAELSVKNPRLWLTSEMLAENGKKSNELYALSVQTSDGDCAIAKKIAFRTLQVDTKGGALTFKVNGRAIFAKGANWIPADALPSRQTDEKYRALLQDAVGANMNMLRVWGGGLYERESFYDICDELGILVWQDFMFACAMYPATKEFLRDVEEEAVFQIKRLRSHPSIALWCGNNENIGALNWYDETKKNRARYEKDYLALYGVIARAVKKHDPSRAWRPSSPCAGEGKNLFADNWHTDGAGDMHFWSVWHEKKDFSEYLSIKPRFVSEFGFSSFPSVESAKIFTRGDELNFMNPDVESRNRSPNGNAVILENFSRYFKIPNGFENMVYLSQVQQALAIKTAVDYWRSLRPVCAGALVWQLNDVWPCVSWSSVEYSGKWKLLHYAQKEFFAPVSCALFKKDGAFRAFVMNDTSKALRATLEIHVLDFDGRPVQKSFKVESTVGADKSKELWKMPVGKFKIDLTSCFFFARLRAVSASGKKYSAEDTFFASPFKSCAPREAKVSRRVKRERSGVFSIALRTTAPAFFVSLDVPNFAGTFSRNMVTLLPKKELKIIFTSRDGDMNAKKFNSLLKIKTLRDSYSER